MKLNLINKTQTAMARLIRKRKEEIGLSPDELQFRGNRKMENILLRVIDFDAATLNERELNSIEEAFGYENTPTVTWLNVDGIHDEKLMKKISEGFHIDQIALAEAMNTNLRPKVEEYDDCIYICMRMLQYRSGEDRIVAEHMSLIIKEHMLITFQEQRGDVFEPVRDRIRKHRRRISTSGTDYLAIALLDIVIDNYIFLISLLGEQIEGLEENLLSQDPKMNVLEEINKYKLELNFIRRNVKPAKEMLLVLGKLESEFIQESSEIHLKQLQDNISQASDVSDSYREILSDQLNIYNTTLSNRMNNIMRVLTIFAAIFIPLTFIAGVYGTNFDVLPELHFRYSYYMMWGIMIAVTAGMLYYFKKNKWF